MSHETSRVTQLEEEILAGRLNRRDVLKRSLALGLSAPVIATLLAACGGDDDDDDETATEEPAGDTEETEAAAETETAEETESAEETEASEETEAASETEAAEETEAEGTEASEEPTAETAAVVVNADDGAPDGTSGELIIALAADPVSLDPIDTYSLNNGRWESHIYSGLTWRDPDMVVYDGEEGRPSPSEGFGLAESWEYVDDLTLNFKLKSGLTFQDGSPVNSEAIKLAFDRMLDPENASPQRFNYTSIESIEVVDDENFVMHFNSVDPVMITKLAGYGGFIPSTAATDDDTKFSTESPVGTGPYSVVEYVKDDHLTFEAWPDFWGDTTPHIQRLNYRIIPDDNTRLSEFLAGSVDLMTLNVSQAQAAEGNPNVQVVDVGVPTVSGLRLDASQAPTDQLEVRQAIAHAIDLQTIIDTIMSGYAKAVGVWQSPFSFGYEEIPPYEYDPEKSKQILADAGLETPIKLTYDVVGSNTQNKEMSAAVKDMLDAVGFEVEVRLQEQATFFDDYRAGKLGNIVPFGWGGWTLDYDNTYISMYYTGESYNPGYSNPEVDALLDEERTTLDQAKRLEIAHQLNELIYNDYPDVALYQNTYLWGVSNRAKNVVLPPDERLWLVDAWLDE